MTARSVPEWIGRRPDTKIPERVKLRLDLKQRGICINCVLPYTRCETDHITPLILGGENRESNLQLLCIPCHKVKTKLDVKLKAKVARIRAKRLGFNRPRRRIQSQGFAKAPPQRNASREIQKWRGYE